MAPTHTREMDAVAAHFADGARSVLVTGTAGVGKSTLLAALASAEGAVVRSLRGCVTKDDVAARLGDDLPKAERPAHAFFLDDAETLDRSALDLLASMLESAPSDRLVLASRLAPRLEGERAVRLEPLPIAESVALLVELARRTAPDYAPDSIEQKALEDLARTLGGLPIALVLAAPRLSLLGAAELARQIRARGVRGAGLLAAEIESTVASLPEEARAVFDRLALVSASFDLRLLERLGGDAHALEAMHARSLLATQRAAGAVRYAIYDSVRDVAIARVSGAIADDVGRAIAEHAGSLAGEVRAGAPRAQADLETLALDVEAAAQRALARGDVEVAAMAVAALDAVPSVAQRMMPLLDAVEAASRGTSFHARVLVVRGRASFQIGALQRGRADMDAALEVVGSESAFIEALAATKAALVRVQAGEDASALFARASAAVERSGDRWLRATFLRDRALGAMRAGRDDAARRDLEDALALEPFADELRALVRGALGQIHQHAGELDAARVRFIETAEAAGLARNEPLRAWALATCGAVEIELARIDAAREHLDEALRIATEQQAGTIEAVALVMLAQLAHESGDAARATVLYQRAIPVLLRAKQQRGAALALAACAAAEASRGRADAAERLLGDARRELTSPRPGDEVALDAFALAVAAARDGDVDPAHAAAIERRAKEVPSSDELRLALRRMRSALDAPRSEATPAAPPALRVAKNGAWFEIESGRVHLPERSPLRRVVAALLDRRQRDPEATLSFGEVFEAAWPGERALASAIANRVKVAVSTLRKAGLKPVLETVGSGYRLAPSVTIAVEAGLTAG